MGRNWKPVLVLSLGMVADSMLVTSWIVSFAAYDLQLDFTSMCAASASTGLNLDHAHDVKPNM
jgi:hypothetical protein